MENTVLDGAGNGRVLAFAAVAAGVVGGLLAAFTGRRDKAPAQGQVTISVTVPPGITDSARQIRKDVRGAVSEGAARAAERGKDARKAARRERKKIAMKTHKAKQHGAGALAGVAASIDPRHLDGKSGVGQLTQTAQHQFEKASRQGSELADQTLHRLDKLSRQSQGTFDELRQQAAGLARTGAEKAQESARTISQTTGARRQEIEKTMGPQARALMDTAGDRFDDLVAEGRARASNLLKDAEKDVLPTVQQFAVQARGSLEKLPEAIADELPGVKERVDRLKSASTALAADAERQVAHLGDTAETIQRQAEERSKQVATAASHGSRNLGATITWVALGSGLVYFVVLNDNQREQVNKVANKVFGRAIETWRDIQGFDQEFA